MRTAKKQPRSHAPRLNKRFPKYILQDVSNLIEVFSIAFGLSMDALAVSISTGISAKRFSWKNAVTVGLYFGFFQFIMPLIGYFLGRGVSSYIEEAGHLIAFGLLAFIGIKMIAESFDSHNKNKESAPLRDGALKPGRLSFLAVATSIDALAAGVSMAFTDMRILSSAAVIGIVTFVLSVAGGMLGKRLGVIFRRGAEIVGGLTLILIGLKILFEHYA